ncbi:prenyltransferase [Marinobacter sp. CHS3-4]|uniref:prenyltransferase n=1 Tax=Marinobacter sp. CHS3-4 TaxID=3045174 RepID=UPI0024B5A168|nr:prenyltransferase [Marinobacter sp. CHS3-4]MDI9246718.1 prenyltransferase [Marinobacter sp. CHS3-4]
MADLARTLAGVSRVPFLVLTPLCVLQGVALAATGGEGISLLRVSLVFVAALAAHILVNVANEVSDFRSGLDLHTERTPFYGGSGTLPASPEGLTAARMSVGASLATLLLSGVFLIWLSGPGLLAFGAVGSLCRYRLPGQRPAAYESVAGPGN